MNAYLHRICTNALEKVKENDAFLKWNYILFLLFVFSNFFLQRT